MGAIFTQTTSVHPLATSTHSPIPSPLHSLIGRRSSLSQGQAVWGETQTPFWLLFPLFALFVLYFGSLLHRSHVLFFRHLPLVRHDSPCPERRVSMTMRHSLVSHSRRTLRYLPLVGLREILVRRCALRPLSVCGWSV